MPWTHVDQRISRQTADCMVRRGAPEVNQILQILHRQETARPELAIDQQGLDPLVGEINLIHQAASGRGFARIGAIRASDQPWTALSPLCHRSVLHASLLEPAIVRLPSAAIDYM